MQTARFTTVISLFLGLAVLVNSVHGKELVASPQSVQANRAEATGNHAGRAAAATEALKAWAVAAKPSKASRSI